MGKIWVPTIGLILLVGFVLLIWWPDTTVTLTQCDVGQGDAILISSGFTQILIDGGPDAAVLECLGKFMPAWDRQIELIVATHPDADHIGGLLHVLKQYQALEIWDNGQHSYKQTAQAADFAALVSSQVRTGALAQAVSSGDRFVAADNNIIATVLAPSRRGRSVAASITDQSEAQLSDKNDSKANENDDGNNGSIVLLLELSNVSVLLMGDVELEREIALLDSALIPDVHILKVGHHGAKTSSSMAFLDTSRPEVALIGVGKKNKYGHPAPEVIERLKQRDALVIRSDELGTVQFRLKEGTISSSVFAKIAPDSRTLEKIAVFE